MATAKPVRPAPVPQVYTPVPQRSDRANFAERGDKMMTSFPPTVDGINRGVDYVNQAVDYTDGAASAVQQQWGLVEQGVRDTQAALEAIKNGPVLSVNGKSGIVTGIVETGLWATYGPSDLMANAPVGRRVAYTSTSGTGTDWPTTTTPCWWHVDTYGNSNRKTQRAEQVYAAGRQQGFVFERFLHDTTWSRWYRVINDGSVIERLRVTAPVSGPITLDVAESSLQYLYITGNVPITIPPPRVGGEQLTLVLGLGSSGSFSFSSNVRAPLGSGPVISGGQIGTFALVAPTLSDNLWLLYRGERHSLT